MYEPINQEFLNSSQHDDCPMPPSACLTNEEREAFADSFLSKYLGEEKMREKDSLRDKIKFKRQQLELATKHLRIQAKKKQTNLAKHAESQDSKLKKKKLILTCKLKKSLRMYKLNKRDHLDYKKYEAINELWKNYAQSCLLTCLPSKLNVDSFCLSEESVLNCLKVLDYHGCHLTVTHSGSKSQIGLTGIVLQDKRNVFFLVTKENKIIILPKSGNLFEFKLFDKFKMTLVGSNMCYRPEMRSTKHAKIKTKLNIK
jgi:ribonuclease P protein subunit POP4